MFYNLFAGELWGAKVSARREGPFFRPALDKKGII